VNSAGRLAIASVCFTLTFAPVSSESQGLVRARPCRGETITAITYTQRPPAFGGQLADANRLWSEFTALPHTTTRSDLVAHYVPVKVGDLCT